jgi:hypothetical protein
VLGVHIGPVRTIVATGARAEPLPVEVGLSARSSGSGHRRPFAAARQRPSPARAAPRSIDSASSVARSSTESRSSRLTTATRCCDSSVRRDQTCPSWMSTCEAALRLRSVARPAETRSRPRPSSSSSRRTARPTLSGGRSRLALTASWPSPSARVGCASGLTRSQSAPRLTT